MHMLAARCALRASCQAYTCLRIRSCLRNGSACCTSGDRLLGLGAVSLRGIRCARVLAPCHPSLITCFVSLWWVSLVWPWVTLQHMRYTAYRPLGLMLWEGKHDPRRWDQYARMIRSVCGDRQDGGASGGGANSGVGSSEVRSEACVRRSAWDGSRRWRFILALWRERAISV